MGAFLLCKTKNYSNKKAENKKKNLLQIDNKDFILSIKDLAKK